MSKISLFCLVHGDSPQHAFPVEIQKSKTIGHLKQLIKEKNQNDFRDIDAKNFTLWKVDISIDDEESLANLTLEDNEKEGVQELVPTWKIRNAFPGELEDNSHHR